MVSKKEMLYQYKMLNELSGKPQEWVIKNYCGNLVDTLRGCAKLKKDGGGCATSKTLEAIKEKIKLLENPPFKLIDNLDWLIYNEKKLLGISITAHSTDIADSQFVADTSCKDFINGKGGRLTFLVEIKAVREILTKKGDKMAFLTVEDSSCIMSDVCVFSKEYEQFAGILYEGNLVFIIGDKDKKKGSLIVKQVVSV